MDLDTAVTALVISVDAQNRILAAPAGATPAQLADPNVLCIEAGGSGDVARNNFDHHDTAQGLPPVCVQALALRSGEHPALERLVRYAAAVDLRQPLAAPAVFPTLSGVFSGMRLSVPTPAAQLHAGLALLRTVLEREIDPFSTMPALPEWRGYIAARRAESDALAADLRRARLFRTNAGRLAGYVESRRFGALGGLYRMGCEIAVACHPAFGDPPRRKYSIGSIGLDLSALTEQLNRLAPGWGGPAHGTVIASGSSTELGSTDRLAAVVQSTL
ncbi:hypothetical protein CKO22_04490 [Thiococcus pfennigii]|nr:hypothetical protein [Thiococcus pfennigii]